MKGFCIGVKIIEVLGEEERFGVPGYSVRYEDGYASWSPKDALEKAYFSMGDNQTSITRTMVNAFIDNVETKQIDTRTVQGKGTCITGFSKWVKSECVNPAKMDKEAEADNCRAEIRAKVWEFLSFVLQWGQRGLKVME